MKWLAVDYGDPRTGLAGCDAGDQHANKPRHAKPLAERCGRHAGKEDQCKGCNHNKTLLLTDAKS